MIKSQLKSTNAQIGETISRLRKAQKMTGVELGRRAHLSQSKISKIENGFYPKLSINEIDRILNILNAPNDVRIEIYRSVQQAGSEGIVKYQHLLEIPKQAAVFEKSASLIRTFTLAIPCLLQTVEVRQYYLEHYILTPDEITQNIKEVACRQELLWDMRRTFHFIFPQTVLYSFDALSGPASLHQLDRLERMMELPNIEVGIIPLEAGLPLSEVCPFVLYDTKNMLIGTLTGDISIDNLEVIASYDKMFDRLEKLALYKDDAKQLISVADKYWRNR